MVVILSGCDCTGKSSCFKLMLKYQKGIFKKGNKSFSLHEVINNLESDLKSHSLIVYDRNSLIDDVVYNPIFTGEDSEIIKKGIQVDHLLNKCKIIYFECDNDELSRRLSLRGDEYITADQFDQIKYNYERAFDLLNISPLRIDTTGFTVNEVYDKVMRVIK